MKNVSAFCIFFIVSAVLSPLYSSFLSPPLHTGGQFWTLLTGWQRDWMPELMGPRALLGAASMMC